VKPMHEQESKITAKQVKTFEERHGESTGSTLHER
jgi:hypothetical protein